MTIRFLGSTMSHWVYTCTLLFFIASFALSLSLRASENKAASDFRPLSSILSANLTERRPFCNRDQVKVASCENALDKIGLSSVPQNFHSQGSSIPGSLMRKLPLRWLSDDGICAIQVQPAKGFVGDISTDGEISANAQWILDLCVRQKQRGGLLMDFGKLTLPSLMLSISQ